MLRGDSEVDMVTVLGSFGPGNEPGGVRARGFVGVDCISGVEARKTGVDETIGPGGIRVGDYLPEVVVPRRADGGVVAA